MAEGNGQDEGIGAARGVPGRQEERVLAANGPGRADEPEFPHDTGFYRTVAILIGLAVLLSIGGIIGLGWALNDKDLPDALVGIGSAGLGYLGGLLAPAPGVRRRRHGGGDAL